MEMSSLRRAFSSSRQFSRLLRTSSVNSYHHHHHHFSHSASTSLRSFDAPIHSHPNTSSINFLFEIRRGFSKKRNTLSIDDYDDGSTVESVDIGATVKTTALSQMEAAIDSLSRELMKLRTGRASIGMLDHIVVETRGVKMPLNGIAAVSVLDPKTLSITPYDSDAVKELEKAIVSSPLGLNPKVEGYRLIVAIPPLTKEHMQAVCKLVTKSSEDVKQSIRRARQKALDTIKKSAPKKKDKEKTPSSISTDDAKKLEKEVEELTKKYIKSAEEMCKAKEKEITES